MAILSRVKNAWSAFVVQNEVPTTNYAQMGPSTAVRADRPNLRFYNDKSIISSIYTRMSIDVASVDIRHVITDTEGRYDRDADSALNQCLCLEPNIDQGPSSFRQDIVLTMFDKGVAAIVPVLTSSDPATDPNFEIYSLRVGEVIAWYPRHVKVSIYNEARGIRQEVTIPKRYVALVENPLYSVMNSPNSTLQRLIRKLQLLDGADEQSSSGKLDLIIQLPYVIKSEARKQQAEQRRADIEFQLKGSQYGIAYTDGTEKITQLNRPTENNLLKQIEYLTVMLYGQLGITEAVMNGTADEKTMINYYNRTIEPILNVVVESMQRAFLGVLKTAQYEKIRYFRDPFKFVEVNNMAEIADKFTRNEILTSNEIRQFLGIKPSKDPKANQLINSNMPQPVDQTAQPQASQPQTGPSVSEMDAIVNQVLDGLSNSVNSMVGG